MSDQFWEHFYHEADIGIRGIAPTMAGAFVEAALALTAVTTDPATVAPTQTVAIRCRAPDAELLLTDWLNALIYEATTRKMLFSRFTVAISGQQLHGTAAGEPIDVARHQPAVEVKGATLTELKVFRDPDGLWRAQCVVDV